MIIENKVKEYKVISVDEFLKLTPNTLKADGRDIKKLKNAIRKGGFGFPVILWNDFIIDGAGRQLAVKEMISEGDTFNEIPVVYVEAKDLNEAKAKALEVSSQFGDITKDSFLAFTDGLEIDFDTFEIKGIDSDLMIEPDEKDDEVPPVPVEPKSKLGDLYELGQHRVLCGDSTQPEAVSSLMDGKKADMVFTDPPYNVAFEGSVHSDGKKSANSKYSSIANDKLSDEEWRSFLDKFISNYFSFCEGVLYICMSGKELHSLTESFTKMGGHWSNYIIWEKNNFTLSRKDFNSKYEPILYGWRDGVSHKYYGTNSEVDIWKIDRTKSNDLHPTMKPIELCSKAITLSTQGSNNIVMDLFLGSGSTLIASEKTGRICYGMELDPKYVDVIVQRYVDFTGIEEVIKNGEKIEWKKTSPTTK
jgi:DNA modification methylase